MASAVASAIAVAGTLLGAALTYLFQRANALRAESFARDERLRQERIAAYSAFAGAMTDLRQAVVSLWFVKQRVREGPDFVAAYTEADRRGAAANHARLRVQLVADDPQVIESAVALFAPIEAITHASDREQLTAREQDLLQALDDFIAAAGRQIR